MKIKKIFNLIEKKYIFLLQVLSLEASNKKFIKYLGKIGVKIEGKPQFISQDVYIDGTDYNLITIGDKSVISREVTLLTHDFAISRAKLALEDYLEKEMRIVKPIRIGNNSFIGAKSIILPGAVIGNNTIIGAGSVVKGYIPDSVVAAGNPCKVICDIETYYKKQIDINSKFII